VVVDDDPTSTNQKEKVWATLMQMMPFLADKLEPSDLAILFEYSPLPQTIVDQWKQKIEESQRQQAPIQQQMQQLQMELLQTKSQLQAAQAAKAAAEAATAGGGDQGAAAQLEYERMLQDGQIKGQQIMTKAQIDAAKVSHDAEIKAQKVQGDAEIAAARATSEHVLKQQKLDNEHAIAQAKILTDVADQRAQRQADLVTEAAWMATDKATKAHSDIVSAAGKVQAAKITAAHRPKTPQAVDSGDAVHPRNMSGSQSVPGAASPWVPSPPRSRRRSASVAAAPRAQPSRQQRSTSGCIPTRSAALPSGRIRR
jgi:hypothetical protein